MSPAKTGEPTTQAFPRVQHRQAWMPGHDAMSHGRGESFPRCVNSVELVLAIRAATVGVDGRDTPHSYQGKGADGAEFGARSVASPSWPGVSRPSTPHRRSADGRDHVRPRR